MLRCLLQFEILTKSGVPLLETTLWKFEVLYKRRSIGTVKDTVQFRYTRFCSPFGVPLVVA